VLLAIIPFCFALGHVTPMLVDRYSEGSPGRAARAYTVNVAGCILGPLVAGYLLLPELGERLSLIALVIPLLAIAAWPALRGAAPARPVWVSALVVAAISLTMRTYADALPEDAVVLRDTTATVAAYGHDRNKRLLVNGVGITNLTPVTKMMAHLPLAAHGAASRALVICFGMGTTTRSLASWGIDVTAVELVPSVPGAFRYFFPDAADIVALDRVHVVIDDGRRFLDRTRASYDVITLDPPPPVEAAGSSLLYSREFYQAVKRRLAEGGLLQQWVWADDPFLLASATRAIVAEFPYVRAFRSPLSRGTHFLASMQPIPARSVEQMIARMPATALNDLVEWSSGETVAAMLGALIDRERPPSALIAGCPRAPALTDDRPTNEYFVLRWLFGRRCS
jgi:hypothetical protein